MPQIPNEIRTLALVPSPPEKQLAKVEAHTFVEARPIPRSDYPVDFEPSQPTESEVAQWNAFIQHESEWRRNLLIMVDGPCRMLEPEERAHLRGQLYEIERDLRSDVGLPWNESHEPLPPAVSQALWQRIFELREQQRANAHFTSASLAHAKLKNDTTLTWQQRKALVKRCERALDEATLRIGRSLPEGWKPKPTDPLRAFRQAAMGAMFPNTGSI